MRFVQLFALIVIAAAPARSEIKPGSYDIAAVVHQHTAGGSTLTMSSPLMRAVGGK